MLLQSESSPNTWAPINVRQRRSVLLVGAVGSLVGSCALVVGLVVGLAWYLAVALFVLLGVLAGVVMQRMAWVVALRLLGGREPQLVAEESLNTALEGLCLSHGLPMPQVRLIHAEAPNALAVARSGEQAAIVITTGMLEQLERIELEGVLAHLLCRIRRGDAAFDTLAGVLVAWPLAKLPSLRHKIMNKVVPAGRSLQADFDSVVLTRYPPGLLRALNAIAAWPDSCHSASVPSQPVIALHIRIHGPDWGIGDTIRHPSLCTRIAALGEL